MLGSIVLKQIVFMLFVTITQSSLLAYCLLFFATIMCWILYYPLNFSPFLQFHSTIITTFSCLHCHIVFKHHTFPTCPTTNTFEHHHNKSPTTLLQLKFFNNTNVLKCLVCQEMCLFIHKKQKLCESLVTSKYYMYIDKCNYDICNILVGDITPRSYHNMLIYTTKMQIYFFLLKMGHYTKVWKSKLKSWKPNDE